MADNTLFSSIKAKCYSMKLKALEMALSTGSTGSHIGGAFSVMEILATLYKIANIQDMNNENRDRIIISKGHCVLALYTVLWQYGFIKENELSTFDINGTELFGHPHRNIEKGIEFSGGSLGLGISYAVGVAMACKRKGLNNKIYVLIGDGECDEGIVWEALMSITHHKLNNVVVIVDRNKYQLDGPTEEIMNNSSLEDKFSSFGFATEVVDGHNIEELFESFTKESDKPRVIIADTVKANGISFLVNNKLSHQCAITKKKYEIAVQEIKDAYGC